MVCQSRPSQADFIPMRLWIHPPLHIATKKHDAFCTEYMRVDQMKPVQIDKSRVDEISQGNTLFRV
ncbi:hypothetical protein Pla52n_34970 [Stieleria varia]|uniref:Uncharacterized protein n=2 Tax=Stieleria varia TaxID=2528005 RepID=A0A5C6ASN9_9BACT|nr:hypothetical protein Pla52n_34970 [Stieleria varia]